MPRKERMAKKTNNLKREVAGQIKAGTLDPRWKGERPTSERVVEALENFSMEIKEKTSFSPEDIATLLRSLKKHKEKKQAVS